MTARAILKAGAVLIALVLIAIFVLWTAAFFNFKPPREHKLIENFQKHRSAYEQVQEMLIADREVRAVYTRSGVETTNSGLPHKPGDVNFPASRYKEYVALLDQIGSESVFRYEESKVQIICFSAWGGGWGGDTRHVEVCWTDREPTNEVASLDNYYRDPKRPRNVFRHIDENWYLKADW